MPEEQKLTVTDIERKAIAFCKEKEITFPIANYLVEFATEATKELQEEPKKNHWHEMYELECLKTKELEEKVKKGRNIVHRLLVVIQGHKWWNYTVIDEARAFMSEVDLDKDHD